MYKAVCEEPASSTTPYCNERERGKKKCKCIFKSMRLECILCFMFWLWFMRRSQCNHIFWNNHRISSTIASTILYTLCVSVTCYTVIYTQLPGVKMYLLPEDTLLEMQFPEVSDKLSRACIIMLFQGSQQEHNDHSLCLPCEGSPPHGYKRD